MKLDREPQSKLLWLFFKLLFEAYPIKPVASIRGKLEPRHLLRVLEADTYKLFARKCRRLVGSEDMFWFALLSQVHPARLRRSMGLFVKQHMSSKPVLSVFRSQVSSSFTLNSFFEVVLHFLEIFAVKTDVLVDSSTSYDVSLVLQRYFAGAEAQMQSLVAQFMGVYQAHEAILGRLVGHLELTMATWESVNMTLFQNLFEQYEDLYSKMWMSVPSLESQQATVNRYFSAYTDSLNRKIGSLGAAQQNTLSSLSASAASIPATPSISGVSAVAPSASLGPIPSIPDMASVPSVPGALVAPIAPLTSLPTAAPGPITQIAPVGPIDSRIDPVTSSDFSNGSTVVVPNASAAGPGDLEYLPDLEYSVEYPSRYGFVLGLGSDPGRSISFSVSSLFGYLKQDYLLFARNLNHLVLRNSSYHLDLPSGSRTVSVVIIDLFRKKLPKLFSYLGHLSLQSQSADGYPLIWQAAGVSGLEPMVFKLHSFDYEFKYLVKYMISHMSQLSFSGGRLGFVNWFSHRVDIKSAKVTRFFKSLLRVKASRVKASAKRGVLVSRTIKLRPKVRHSVQVYRVAARPKMVFQSGASSAVGGALDASNIHHLFKGLKAHLQKHGSKSSTRVFHTTSTVHYPPQVVSSNSTTFNVNPYSIQIPGVKFLGDGK